MNDLFLFIGQQWMLVTVFFVLLTLLMVHETRKGGAAISTAQLTQLVNNDDALILDVRDGADFKTGHIVDAMHIPQAKVEGQLQQLEKYRQKPVVVVCKMGQHSGMVSKMLKESGFEQVYKLSGGMMEWRGSQLPVVKS